MAYKLVFREQAENDLHQLYAYIKQESGPGSAQRFIGQVEEFCRNLASMPLRGFQRDDIRSGLRVASYRRRVAVAFLIDGHTVRIGRIVYRGRDLDALLDEDDGQD